MRTLSALEIKRRGVIAIEEALQDGPVHVIKRNKLAFVIMSEHDYASITQRQDLVSLWNLLDKRSWQGQRSKKNIDEQIRQERDNWDV